MAIKKYGGCDSLNQAISYPDRKEGIKVYQDTDRHGWAKGDANKLLVPIFSFLDGLVLYSIFDECMTQSAAMGIIMAFGIAVVLNTLPLIIARYVHSAFDKTEKNAAFMAAMFISGFLLIYGGTVYLRFAYSDMYGQEKQSAELTNTVQDEEEITEDDGRNEKKGIAVVILLSISPLITSLIGFGIAYVSEDPLKDKIECLDIGIVEDEQKIAETEAAIIQMKKAMEDGEREMIDHDEKLLAAAFDDTDKRGDLLKSLARLYLTEYLANPSATSRISQEMKVSDKAANANGSAGVSNPADHAADNSSVSSYADYLDSTDSVDDTEYTDNTGNAA